VDYDMINRVAAGQALQLQRSNIDRNTIDVGATAAARATKGMKAPKLKPVVLLNGTHAMEMDGKIFSTEHAVALNAERCRLLNLKNAKEGESSSSSTSSSSSSPRASSPLKAATIVLSSLGLSDDDEEEEELPSASVAQHMEVAEPPDEDLMSLHKKDPKGKKKSAVSVTVAKTRGVRRSAPSVVDSAVASSDVTVAKTSRPSALAAQKKIAEKPLTKKQKIGLMATAPGVVTAADIVTLVKSSSRLIGAK
jgi:hypothetical protein